MNSLEIQQAIYNRLAGIYELGATVYDHAPQDEEFPYVTIGEGTATQWDTDDSLGSEETVTIHVWSRYRGRKEVKEIQAEIYDALHRYELPVTGSHTVTVEWEYADTFLDPDGLSRHGVQRFRITTEQQ
jgi:hypothetical protein